jgi:hypothetical protein
MRISVFKILWVDCLPGDFDFLSLSSFVARNKFLFNILSARNACLPLEQTHKIMNGHVIQMGRIWNCLLSPFGSTFWVTFCYEHWDAMNIEAHPHGIYLHKIAGMIRDVMVQWNDTGARDRLMVSVLGQHCTGGWRWIFGSRGVPIVHTF